jgi:uncharacterized protein YndB with AHSA1/START domain
MKSEPFIIERTFNAPVERVWKAITDINDMRQWYFDIPAFKPEPGFEFRFYGGTEEKKYRHLCKVTAVTPGKKIAYSWRYDGYPGSSTVTFELFGEGGKTRLKLTHEGIETFSQDDPNFAAESFAQGWSQIISVNLKTFSEQNA